MTYGAAVVFTILAAVLFVLLVGFARPIAVLMQAPEEAVSLTTSYVRICGCGILFIVAYNLLSAVFRGLGDSRSPLLFSMVGYFNGNNKTLWVMIQGLVQTLLVRLPLAFYMSMQPNASLTKIGLSAPAATVVGILLNIMFYIYINRKNAEERRVR
ncbi:MATE family efflux transporter [Agathobaculum sp.]|uniref:MATE family efflux transporter n=1 Tax=Agathobaculum sp. TaxID=2048138 RepID=UPI003AF0D091